MERLKWRILVAAALTAGFYGLAGIVVVILVAIPVATVAFLHGLPVRILLYCAIGAGIVIWSVMPRRERFLAPGPPLLASEQARLFDLLNSVAMRAGERPPDEVYAVADVNAGVSDHGRRRVMVLGLPLIQVLTVSELEAAVAHELGHYAGGDTRQAWVYRTREKIARALTTLRGGWRLLRLPFVLYARLFMYVTQAASRRQEYAADRLAARIVGAQPVASMLRSATAASAGFRNYWSQEFLPVLNAGYRPPFMEGFGVFLANPSVHEALESALDRLLAEAPSHPYDSHPPVALRIEALASLPRGGIARSQPAASLLDDVPQLESRLIESLLIAGAPAPNPVSWSEAIGAMLPQQWARTDQRILALLATRTVAGCPAVAADAESYGRRVAAIEEREVTAPSELRELTSSVLGIALALALHRAGWRVEAPPGMEVALVRDGGYELKPFTAATQLVRGEIGPDQWRAACDRLGITQLRLVATESVQPETKAGRPDTGHAWYPLSKRCQLGWWDRNSVLLVSSRGLLKRRVGHRAAYAAGLAGLIGVGGSAKGEPVWLSDADCERVAAEHPKNVWVQRDTIARAWLRKGISVDRVRLQVGGGRDVKLIFPTQEGLYPALKQILSEWLGDRLTLR